MIIDMPTVSMGNSGKILPADKVSYSNTTSGLEADNVQDAIDEVNSDLEDLSNSLMGDLYTNTVNSIPISPNANTVVQSHNVSEGTYFVIVKNYYHTKINNACTVGADLSLRDSDDVDIPNSCLTSAFLLNFSSGQIDNTFSAMGIVSVPSEGGKIVAIAPYWQNTAAYTLYSQTFSVIRIK